MGTKNRSKDSLVRQLGTQRRMADEKRKVPDSMKGRLKPGKPIPNEKILEKKRESIPKKKGKRK